MLKVLKEYINKRIDLLKLDLTLISSNILSTFILIVVAIGLFLMFFFMLSLALSMFLGKMFDNYGLGILIFSLIYLLLFFLLISFRKPLKRYFVDKLSDIQNDIEEE